MRAHATYARIVDRYELSGHDLHLSDAATLTVALIGATANVNEKPDNLLLPDKLWRFVWVKPLARCHIMCASGKQRNGEFEAKFGFWFDVDSQQYQESVGDVPSRYSLGSA